MPPGVPGSEIKGQKPRWLSGGDGWVQPHPRHHELDTFFLAWSRSNVHTVMLTGRWGVGRICKDFPSAPVVPNPLCNAGDMGLIPVGGSAIPGATEQLSRPTMESTQVHALAAEEGLHGATDILRAATKTQRSQTNRFKN